MQCRGGGRRATDGAFVFVVAPTAPRASAGLSVPGADARVRDHDRIRSTRRPARHRAPCQPAVPRDRRLRPVAVVAGAPPERGLRRQHQRLRPAADRRAPLPQAGGLRDRAHLGVAPRRHPARGPRVSARGRAAGDGVDGPRRGPGGLGVLAWRGAAAGPRRRAPAAQGPGARVPLGAGDAALPPRRGVRGGRVPGQARRGRLHRHRCGPPGGGGRARGVRPRQRAALPRDRAARPGEGRAARGRHLAVGELRSRGGHRRHPELAAPGGALRRGRDLPGEPRDPGARAGERGGLSDRLRGGVRAHGGPGHRRLGGQDRRSGHRARRDARPALRGRPLGDPERAGGTPARGRPHHRRVQPGERRRGHLPRGSPRAGDGTRRPGGAGGRARAPDARAARPAPAGEGAGDRPRDPGLVPAQVGPDHPGLRPGGHDHPAR